MSRRVVIHDASVLIDLAAGGLLGSFVRLGWHSETTDLVLQEVQGDHTLSNWVGEHLQVTALSSENLIELRLSASKGLSNGDLSALYLAQKRQGTLLTNDGKLRKAAEAAKVPYQGILGIMTCLHEAKICSGKRLCQALDEILAVGARLPPKDCEERRATWSEGQIP